MTDVASKPEAYTAESLIRALERNRGVTCAGCQKPLSLHESLLAIAIGFKNAPRCVPCMAAALDADPPRLCDSMLTFVLQRECYAGAWNWANQEAGCAQGPSPSSLLRGNRSVPNSN